MFHTSAFATNTAASLTTFQQTNAVQDQALPPFNNNVIVPPQLLNLMAGYAFGASIGRAQLQSPSLRVPAQMDIAEVSTTLVTLQNQARFKFYGAGMPNFAPGEQLSAFTINTSAGTDWEFVAVWLADKIPVPTSAEFRTIRATAAANMVANVWTNTGILAFEQTLPPGNYNVVGARCVSATAVVFRLVFPGYPWRPGGIANTDAFGIEPPFQRYGQMGVWGQFNTSTFLTVDYLCTGADAAQVVELDVAPAQM